MAKPAPQTATCDIRVENGVATFTADFEGNVWKWSVPVDNLAQAMGYCLSLNLIADG
jgi:hypothetical protein